MQGIKFKMKDGTWDYYDPLNQSDFSETETDYLLDMTYKYEIAKNEVDFYEWYELCNDCGHEVFEEGCRRCFSEKELKELWN